MNKIKSILRKIFRLEDKQNPTSHQINDREMMDALYQSNKVAIDAQETETQRVADEIAEKQRLVDEAELAIKVKAMQESNERDRIAKEDAKRRTAEFKFKQKRAKDKIKNDQKRIKMHRKGQGW